MSDADDKTAGLLTVYLLSMTVNEQAFDTLGHGIVA